MNGTPERGQKTTVQSITRAAGILRRIMEGVHSVKEISRQCGLSVATVHRILKALVESEMVFQDPTDRKYYLGALFTRLSLNPFDEHRYFIAQATEEVNRIWELFGEFTALDIQVGLQTVSLKSLLSKHNYGVTGMSGSIFYGANSKVLLAQHDDKEIDVILKNITPQPPSEQCFVDREALKEQFREARRQGYYISKEFGDGMMGISVIIKGYLYPASLNIAGPESRLDSIALKVVEEMKRSADRIAANIAASE